VTGRAKGVEQKAMADWTMMVASVASFTKPKTRKRPWVEDHHEYFRVRAPESHGETITFTMTAGGDLGVYQLSYGGEEELEFNIPRRFAKRLVAWLKDKLEDDE